MGKPSSEPFLPNIKPSYISVSILETKKGIEKKNKRKFERFTFDTSSYS